MEAPLARSAQIRTWMETRYHDPKASVEMLGRDLSMGSDATSREVRRAFQDSFKGALNRVRLQEARRLLKESELGIAEIAYKVGYGNVSHFNRLAKDAWGCTPTEERARTRAEGQS
jgi:AraC-like DNA-binding protein